MPWKSTAAHTEDPRVPSPWVLGGMEAKRPSGMVQKWRDWDGGWKGQGRSQGTEQRAVTEKIQGPQWDLGEGIGKVRDRGWRWRGSGEECKDRVGRKRDEN